MSGILYVSYLLRWSVTYEKGFLLGIGVAMALGGILVEGSISAMGQMQYVFPAIYHVPLWLGGVYLHGSFALREGIRFLVYPSTSTKNL